ncbi:MAG: ABC transporter substrate-binding protein [Synergistaceae bacterium]|jgi:branched-chain amino acid transport system substrate-binding protein|nr:ABC transporter substrate-binding protein [Synergistaceae bacterium]
MKVKSTLCAIIVLLACLFCGAASAADTIKIGVLAPITGFAASDGFSTIESIKLAQEKVNAAGGVLGKQIEVVYYDDAADPKQAVPLANKLITQDKVVAFVAGSYSMPSRAVAPIFDEEEIPLVAAYALHPEITNGDYTFRNGFLGTTEGRVAAYTALELFKAKTVALVTSDNDFGQTLKDGFVGYLKSVGREKDLILQQTYPSSEKDFAVYLSKIKDAAPDVVFFSGYYFQTAPALKQAKEMGIENIRFIGEQGSDSPKMAEIALDAAEGFVILTNLDRDDKRPFVQEFLKSYRDRHNIEPDMVGASAYDAFMIIVDAIKTAGGTDGKAIRDAIAATKNYDGLTGVINGFDAAGEVLKPVQLQEIKEGKFRYFGIVTDSELIKP